MRLRRPSVLHPGDRVALVCPSGPIRSEAELEGCRKALADLGLKVRLGRNVRRRVDYLAGTDAQRAADLNAALRDPAIRGVFCVRGGYGAGRILPLIDFDALCEDPKLFVGFSDLTALHAGIQRKARVATLHATTVASAYVNEGITDESRALMERLIFDPSPVGSVAEAMGRGVGEALRGGTAEGRLIGGNLTVLASILGSGYEPRPTNAILFLEDIGEEPYRLDRCLNQLRLAGWLDRARGLVLGQFTRCHSRNPGRLGAMETLARCVEDLRIPILAGFPAGHAKLTAALPLGCRVVLDADGADMVLREGMRAVR